MLEYKFRESGGGLEGKARGSHPVRQRKTPMPLKKLKLIILTPFDATYSPPPLGILGDFLPVFKLLCMYKGMLANFMPNSEPRDLSWKLR